MRLSQRPDYIRPLIPSVVALAPFDSAIANACMRIHSDKIREHHSNGDT